MKELWGVFDDHRFEVDFFETHEEALRNANARFDSMEHIPREYFDGALWVFQVTDESAVIAKRTPEEQESLGFSPIDGAEFYVDMGMVAVGNELLDAARELLRLRSIKGTPEYCEKKEAAWAALEKAVKGDRNDE